MRRTLLLLFLFVFFSASFVAANYMFFVAGKGEVKLLSWQVPVWFEYAFSFLTIEFSFVFSWLSGAMFLNHATSGRVISEASLYKVECIVENKMYWFSVFLTPPLWILLIWGVADTWFF